MMTRFKFSIPVLVSLLLMFGSCVSWALSYFDCNVVTVATDRQMFFAASRGGELEIYSLKYLQHEDVKADLNTQGVVASTQNSLASDVLSPLNSIVGVSSRKFSYLHDGKRCVDAVQFAIPFWLVTSVFGVLPFMWIAMHWRRFAAVRRLQGQCVECGYDLRASEGSCPECGTLPEALCQPLVVST
jgi:hypothetical protein